MTIYMSKLLREYFQKIRNWNFYVKQKIHNGDLKWQKDWSQTKNDLKQKSCKVANCKKKKVKLQPDTPKQLKSRCKLTLYKLTLMTIVKSENQTCNGFLGIRGL